MKLIDRDELLATFERDVDVNVTGRKNAEEVKRVLQTIYDDIKESPVVDAVEVVRCKDCKWYEFDRKMHCGLPHGVRSKDDYCSDAERKEE